MTWGRLLIALGLPTCVGLDEDIITPITCDMRETLGFANPISHALTSCVPYADASQSGSHTISSVLMYAVTILVQW
jgi:hypothetical protein